jgi:3-deoxy-7-phosphoheptulonate synthase
VVKASSVTVPGDSGWVTPRRFLDQQQSEQGKARKEMTDKKVDDLNVLNEETLITPDALKAELPLTDRALTTVANGRKAIRNILEREDPRLFVVVGPCSIHDMDAARDYAARLVELADELSDTLLLVMRVYFEKPRTTVGWKGFINDPHMNDSFNIDEGLHLSRQLLLELAEMGMPTSTEALDPVTPQYMQDLIAWSAIGARTAESQTHREMASGLSSAIGFKNGTDGSLDVAINALKSVSAPHRFLGINHRGQVSVIHTRGNANAHVVLRGGGGSTNYDALSIAECEGQLVKAGCAANIMVDCSHANSSKDPAKQVDVMADVGGQVSAGNQSVVGFMVESNIGWGNQSIPADKSDLTYGVSVTDACVDWATTCEMLRALSSAVKPHLEGRRAPSTATV